MPFRNGAPEVDPLGLQLDSTFKFWFEIRVMLNGGGPYVIEYPTAGVAGTPDEWADATVGAVGCGNVVSLNGWTIHTNNNPSHQIRYGSGQTNELVCEPENNSGNQLAMNALAARFHIANWGSIPNDPNNATNL